MNTLEQERSPSPGRLELSCQGTSSFKESCSLDFVAKCAVGRHNKAWTELQLDFVTRVVDTNRVVLGARHVDALLKHPHPSLPQLNHARNTRDLAELLRNDSTVLTPHG